MCRSSRGPRAVLERLCQLGRDPRLLLGFVIFYDLGLTLTGFHDGDVDQRGATLFIKGAHDVRRPKTTAFSLVK